ncbi:MAG: hypothetical protein ABJ360_12785, partial [Roseobacter sp.]
MAVTDVSFALEATDETPESEIIIDPALLADEEPNESVVFADQQEVVAEIPEDVVKSDKIANDQAKQSSAKNVGFVNDGASSLKQLV